MLFVFLLIATDSYNKFVSTNNVREMHFETAEGVVGGRERVIDEAECNTSCRLIEFFLLVIVLRKKSGVSKLNFRVDFVLCTHSFLALTQNTIYAL
jgi:hypothetical protein